MDKRFYIGGWKWFIGTKPASKYRRILRFGFEVMLRPAFMLEFLFGTFYIRVWDRRSK